MAGLNFQTQTIINSNFDPDSKKELFKATSGHLKIRRDFDFFKEDDKGRVVAVRSVAGFEPKMCKATIDFKKILEALKDESHNVPTTYCRLDVYLGVEGAEPFIYSTPWVQKGKPFWLEFTIPAQNVTNDATTAATKVAADVVKEIKKSHMFQVDKDLIVASSSGAVLTLEGANEYQRLRNVEVMVYEANEDSAKSVAKLVKNTKDADGTPNTSEMSTAIIKEAERGINGFGTYSQIVKDLRLPTAANWQPNHIRQVETPIIGAIYDQFIIEYAAPASNEGLACVGQKLESNTTHVFWVKHDVADTFSKALTTAFDSLYTPGNNVEAAAMHTASTISEDKPVKGGLKN